MSNTYGFGPGPVGYGGYGSPADQAQRLAQAQLAEGSATTPIRSKWQGAARLANALMGGLGVRQGMQGAQDSNAVAVKLAQAAAGGGGTMGGGGGLPAAPGALADLQGATADTPNLTDANFAGLKDSDIMGQGPQMGPPMPAMAPNNMGGAPPPGAIPGGAMVGQNQMPPQGVQVASNDPNFMPSFPSPSADKGQAATFNPADLAMFQQDMQGAPGAVSQPPQGGGGGDLDTLKANIAQTESGGNYGAQGPTTKSGDHAYGKYQVMGANVPSWTSAEGQSETPSQFLSDPNMQEKVASDRLGSAMSKYGPAGAAREWFTGSPTGKGSDVNGMTADKYAALATGGGGNSFLHSSVAGPGAPSAIGSPPPPQNDQQMFQQDQGSGEPQQDQQQQGGSGMPPQMMDGIKQILMNPYASPEAKQMATGLLQKYIQPQWETVNRPDGSVIAINKNNPQQNRMIAPAVRPSSFTQIGVDASGNPRYGFVNPATGQIQPADTQGGGGAPASPYVPRTVGAPGQPAPQGAPAPGGAPNIPQPNPAWTPQPAQSAAGAGPGQPQPQGTAQGEKPNTFQTPDYTVNRTPGEDKIDQMAANDPNPANASLYTRARNIMLGNEPAPLVGVAGTKPVDIATMNVVRQADPNFNSALAAMRAENIKNWQDKVTPNSQGGQLYAANGSLEHLGILTKTNNDLAGSQSNSAALNGVQGWLANNLPFVPHAGNDVAVKRSAYSSATEPVVEEIGRLYAGGPGSEASRDRLIANLGPDNPPDVRQAAIKTYTQLLAGKVDELKGKWQQAGFASPFPAFSSKAQDVMDNIIGPQGGQQGGQPGSGQGQIPGQPQLPSGNDPLSQARAAIAKGAPRAAVLQRLQQMGVNPAGL